MEQQVYDYHTASQFKHWWFKGRFDIVQSFCAALNGTNQRILEIGAGFGAMLPILKKWGNVDAIEIYEPAHEQLMQYGADQVLKIGDFPQTIPEKTYTTVAMFDVLEHIEDDQKALRRIHDEVLEDDGHLVITVPAYEWLWTHFDDINQHFRRYTRSNLMSKVKAAGFSDLRCSYYMTFLFPLAVLQRIVQKLTRTGETNETPGSFLNSLFYRIFSSEKQLVKAVGMPFGLSIILVAKKTNAFTSHDV